MKFVNFHGHSNFSIGDATGFPKEHFDFVLKNAGEDSMACAITDHGNSNGFGYIASAQKDFKNKDVPFKAIYGNEFYLHPDLDLWLEQKTQAKIEAETTTELVVENEDESKSKQQDPIKRRHHLVIWAYNQEGLKNLYKLCSFSYKKGFYRFPRVDFKILEKHNEGLMISSACLHPDSMIITDKGLLTIKQVIDLVKNAQKVLVCSYDETLQINVFRKVLWGDCTRKNAKLLKIKTVDGKEIKLTPDHKVLTDSGWKEAQHLSINDKILSF